MTPALMSLLWLAASDPLAGAKGKVAVVLFLSAECPVSNRYVPEIQRLHSRYGAAAFYAVYPNAGETDALVESHAREFGVPGIRLRDPRLLLATRTGVRMTPEAAVLNPEGRVLYRGRIDDRYLTLGKMRPRPLRRDLEAAIESALAGRAAPPSRAPAAGCAIQGLR